MTSSDEATSTPLSNRPLSARAQRAVTAMKAATAAKRSPRVVVDPSDPATIERAAAPIHRQLEEWCYCTHAAEFGGQDDCKALAAAVLAALATPTDEGQK